MSHGSRANELFEILPKLKPLRLLDGTPVVGKRKKLGGCTGNQAATFLDNKGDARIDIEEYLTAFATGGDHRAGRPVHSSDGGDEVVWSG